MSSCRVWIFCISVFVSWLCCIFDPLNINLLCCVFLWFLYLLCQFLLTVKRDLKQTLALLFSPLWNLLLRARKSLEGNFIPSTIESFVCIPYSFDPQQVFCCVFILFVFFHTFSGFVVNFYSFFFSSLCEHKTSFQHWRNSIRIANYFHLPSLKLFIHSLSNKNNLRKTKIASEWNNPLDVFVLHFFVLKTFLLFNPRQKSNHKRRDGVNQCIIWTKEKQMINREKADDNNLLLYFLLKEGSAKDFVSNIIFVLFVKVIWMKFVSLNVILNYFVSNHFMSAAAANIVCHTLVNVLLVMLK